MGFLVAITGIEVKAVGSDDFDRGHDDQFSDTVAQLESRTKGVRHRRRQPTSDDPTRLCALREPSGYRMTRRLDPKFLRPKGFFRRETFG